jgi:hypothetical protein
VLEKEKQVKKPNKIYAFCYTYYIYSCFYRKKLKKIIKIYDFLEKKYYILCLFLNRKKFCDFNKLFLKKLLHFHKRCDKIVKHSADIGELCLEVGAICVEAVSDCT